MNTNGKILIDKFIGLPLAYLMNFAARILGFILRPDHSLDKEFKTIAICKFYGMGSIIQSTPLIKTLRTKYPQAKIIYITHINHVSLFKHIQGIDSIYTINDSSLLTLLFSSINLIFKCWSKRIDVYIDLEIYSNYSSLITTASVAKNRFGYFKSDKNYRMGMYTHMMFFNALNPIAETYLQFARLLGCTIESNEPLQLINFENKEVKVKMKELGISENYIVINPNASDLRLERRWPKEKFIELCHKLSTYQIVLIGSKAESPYVETIASQTKAVNTCGKLTLSELIYLISKSTLVVTNDTGPMHIAFAQQVKTLALFGPCSPLQYGQNKNTSAIYKKVYCSPCVHEFIIPPCKGDNQCMKKITIDEVYTEAIHLFKNENNSIGEKNIEYTADDSKPLGLLLR